MNATIKILTIFLVILCSSCQAYFKTVYELDAKQEQFFESRDFRSYWDLCLSNKTKKEYNDIANSMSSSSSKYYLFYEYLDKLPCVDARKMKGKDLFVFCLEKSISLVEYVQNADIKGTTGEVKKLGDFTVFKFINKDSCLTYQVEGKELPNKGALLIKEGKGWKFAYSEDRNSHVVLGFISLLSDPDILEKFPICQDD
jgi:hypothetical protein